MKKVAKRGRPRINPERVEPRTKKRPDNRIGEPRTNCLTIRYSMDEYALIRKVAEHRGITMARLGADNIIREAMRYASKNGIESEYINLARAGKRKKKGL